MSNRSISQKSIFGEYKNGEDRVTAALLQIFRLGGPELMNSVFEDFNINLDAQVNTQVKKIGSKSRPDGELTANYHVFIESKIYPWDINKEHNVAQLQEHLKLIKAERAVIIYITVDKTKPMEIPNREDVYWTTWTDITQRLKKYNPSFNKDVMSFLADQFKLLVDNVVFSRIDDTTDENRVLIVGGRFAEGIARNYGFYSCQSGRKFKKSKYIAFYFNKRISHYLEIEGEPRSVKTLEEVKDLLPEDYLLSDEDRKPHTFIKFNIGYTINEPITHDYPNPFVQRQRYTTIEKLRSAKTTDDLL